MEIEKQIIKTYSRRQPVTRYESSAVFVPSYRDPQHVRESRLNDKTLVVDNFDDTFDRLADGVAVSSAEKSPDENGVAGRKDSDIFGVFKMPLQAKKKPKQRGKPKKKDVASKVAVKRKKAEVGSDDSGSSDQEEKKQDDKKKSKEKVKKVVKRKKDLSPVKLARDDEPFVGESADENVSDNVESNGKETNDSFKKPKESSNVSQIKISNYFQASTPRVNRVHANIDMQNISPVVMEKDVEKEKRFLPQLSVHDENAEDGEHGASENAEGNQDNGTGATDNFAKPRESLKVHQLKASHNLLTSTPRVSKMRTPVNLQNLSPIISDKEKRVIHDVDEKAVDTNSDGNCEVESHVNDDVQVPSDRAVEPVESPTKLDEIQSDPVENNCSAPNGVEESEKPLSDKEKSASQSNQQESLVPSDENNENNNKDEEKSGNDSLESIAANQDNTLVPAMNAAKEVSNKAPPVNEDPHGNSQSFVPSPLLFDDSECIQSHVGKNNVLPKIAEEDVIKINFSQHVPKEVEESKKESANLENSHVEPPAVIDKGKNFDVSSVSSYYPHDWTNDYDSTYGYDQLKNNPEKDAAVDSKVDQAEGKDSTVDSKVDEVEGKNSTVDSKLDEGEDKNSSSCSEKTNDLGAENVTDVNEASEHDNTEIHSVGKQDQTERTICDEDNNALEDNRSESDEQEKSRKDGDAATISSEDDHNSVNVENVTFPSSEIIIEQRKSSEPDENESLVLELDESQNESESSEEEAFIIRPSKRRKTDTSEILIYENVEDDRANEEKVLQKSDEKIDELVSVSEETVNSETNESTSSAQPVSEPEKIVEKIQEKELRIILERINYEEYKSPILSRGKPVKRKSTKRVSRKSKDTDTTVIAKKTTPKIARVTRRSVTEDRMQQLYVQYQCKGVTIFAVRLEDQKLALPSRRSSKRKSSISEDNDGGDSSLTNGGLSEFLAKLHDPVKVTTRRKTHKRFDGQLAAITEDQANQNSEEEEVGKKAVTWGNDKRVTFDAFSEDSEDTEDVGRKSQPIFLKPGKSWARSLSIINHFHNGKNLDELAAGRENWRHSVQTVLNMQPEASARSSAHEESRRESRASSHRESKSMRKSSIANSRFSMRIIPGGKRSTLTDDPLDSQRTSYVSDRSRVSRKTSLKIRRDTLIETEDDLIKSARDIILKRCKQTSYEPFGVCFPDSYIDNCRKIGEGVYGEVFLYEDDSEKSVIKIIPIEGDQLVNCEPQKKFHEILSEIIIAEELHKLRFDGDFNTNGFVEVNRIMCVVGKYPEKLIDLWYAYDEQKKSENDCPSMFEDDQLYIILELAHGGQDLEAYTFQNASESYAIFLQTALTLAVAEQSLEFEHRDLHWGNLLISKTEDKQTTYKLGGEEISLPTKGVKVAVIDFTLSRMSYQGCKIFNDLAADPTLFEAQGEYQFDIYRMMRDNVNNDWQQFNPFTNVLWMDYTLEKMITAARYRRKTTKIHKSAIDDMKALRKEIMNYSSAFDFVTNCKKVQALFDST